jgi:hypothetical protein
MKNKKLLDGLLLAAEKLHNKDRYFCCFAIYDLAYYLLDINNAEANYIAKNFRILFSLGEEDYFENKYPELLESHEFDIEIRILALLMAYQYFKTEGFFTQYIKKKN